MKKIDAVICIGGGKSQLPLIKEVVALKLALIIIDRNKHSLGFHYADEILQLSTFESAPIIDELHSLIMAYMINNNISEIKIYQPKPVKEDKKVTLKFYAGLDEKGNYIEIRLEIEK